MKEIEPRMKEIEDHSFLGVKVVLCHRIED
jgi:hypothetical protein